MLVEDLMTESVVTVPADATLREAIGRLLAEDVGSVIVVDGDGNPGGIVTETDTLEAVHGSDAPPSERDILDLTHGAVVTTTPDATVQGVARTMARENVKKVPVLDDLDLVGVITLTDVVWHLSEIRQEALDLAADRAEWESEE